jgi:hypothetical protein
MMHGFYPPQMEMRSSEKSKRKDKNKKDKKKKKKDRRRKYSEDSGNIRNKYLGYDDKNKNPSEL